MSSSDSESVPAEGADAEAAAWVVRHERGLTPEEQDAFCAWLAADGAHRAAFAEQRWSWEELDRLNGLQTSSLTLPEATQPELPPRPRTGRWWRAAPVAAAAFVATVTILHLNRPPASVRSETVATLPLCQEETLPDSSRISLNRGAGISVVFTQTERRVRLEHGEAHFTVAKDPQRPFVVEVEGVAVRAVGTAFSVRRGADAVAVLVTEGTVALLAQADSHPERPPLVTAGQKAVVSLTTPSAATVIEAVAAAEIEERLIWVPRMLEFDEVPLAGIAAEFNRRNPVRIEIPDAALRDRRLSAALRSDNVEGFVRLLESDFGISVSRRRAEEIILRPAR